MGIATEALREYIVFAIDVIRRRWALLLVPVLIAGIAGFAAVKLSPKKYTATSLLLLQGANRGTGGGPVPQSNAMEQVHALEAWLKSDQVMTELLPQMSNYKPPTTPAELLLQTRTLAASLSLELAGNSVLQISLQGSNPTGLGRNLEIVIARLMEGLTGPEQNVLSAPQFMLMRRSEDVTLTDKALNKAIDAAQLQSPRQVRATLQQLWTLTNERVAAGTAANANTAESIRNLRQSISPDPTLVRRLEQLYAEHEMALDREERLKRQGTPSRGNYVGIFDSPDNLLVVGRPKDPIFGESVAKKPAIGLILLSMLLAGGLVVLIELLDGRVRLRKEYESIAGLPVVARLGKMPDSETA